MHFWLYMIDRPFEAPNKPQQKQTALKAVDSIDIQAGAPLSDGVAQRLRHCCTAAGALPGSGFAHHSTRMAAS